MYILVFKFVGSVEGDHTVSPVELTLHLLAQDSHHFCAILSSLLPRKCLNNQRVTTDLNLKVPSSFLLTRGAGNSSYFSLGLIYASATAFLKSWCNNKYFFYSVLNIDMQVDHICISNHNTDRPK